MVSLTFDKKLCKIQKKLFGQLKLEYKIGVRSKKFYFCYIHFIIFLDEPA